MRIRRRTLRRLFPLSLLFLLFLLFAAPALSQNLLANPGFDRDLAGWTPRTLDGSDTTPTAQAFVAWDSADGSGSASSGSVALHADALQPHTLAAVGQCVAVSSPSLVTFGARFLTRSERLSDVTVRAGFFSSGDCSGAKLSSASAPPNPSSVTVGWNSGGQWLPTQTSALVPAGGRSAFVEVTAEALWTWSYGRGWADVVADDAFFIVTPSQQTVSLLPSAAWISGNGAYWSTRMTLVNPGAVDAAVTLKWLGHDMDGRGGAERAYLVRAGQTMDLSEEEWEINHPQNYGAILVTSSSRSLFLQSETSTSVSGGGSVGQALPAFGPADFAGSAPKMLAPIRENESFRTNLVLANATEIPVTAHVALFAADGTPLGSRDVALPPLGMTQINRVASALGVTSLDAGRITVSTPTPGGLVAAYASVIDNVTNDPRTLLPQDVPEGSSAPNLLANPRFDRDLTGWTLTLSDVSLNAGRAGTWTNIDANNDGASGSALLSASSAGFDGYGWATLTQCVPVVASRLYGLQASVRGDASGFYGNVPSPGLHASFRPGADCAGTEIGRIGAALFPFNRTSTRNSTGGEWYTLAAPAESAPDSAHSALLMLSVGASGSVRGADIATYFDDVSFFEGDSTWAWFVPSAASVIGSGGSRWTTDLAISNAGVEAASVYVESAPRGLDSWVVNVGGGETLSLQNILVSIFGHDETFGPLRITGTSPSIAVTAETSSPTAGGGTVGQALAAFDASELAGSTPRTLAPIRENASFRTNLVLANPTEIPITAHVALLAADGGAIGSRDVDLPPLGMTQINRVASALGAATLDAGRIAVSTPTPGGLVAAYASVIDNVTNDPRTLLPR